MYGNESRRKPTGWVLEEFRRINGLGKSTFIVDDNAAPGGPRDLERLEAIASMDEKGRERSAQVTIYAAKNEKLVKLPITASCGASKY